MRHDPKVVTYFPLGCFVTEQSHRPGTPGGKYGKAGLLSLAPGTAGYLVNDVPSSQSVRNGSERFDGVAVVPPQMTSVGVREASAAIVAPPEQPVMLREEETPTRCQPMATLGEAK